MTTPTTGQDPRYVSSNDRHAVLRAWAGADAAVDMGGWIDDDHEAFQAAVRRQLKDVANLARVQIVVNDERGTIVVDHAPERAGSCTCADPAERARHRRRAKARASKCLTCRPGPSGYGHGKDGISACLGCGTLIAYFSCAPGYCVLCSHDPCWVKVS